MKPAVANADKPHRCPKCWTIPDKAYKHGYAKRFRFYTCSTCKVFWTRMVKA